MGKSRLTYPEFLNALALLAERMYKHKTGASDPSRASTLAGCGAGARAAGAAGPAGPPGPAGAAGAAVAKPGGCRTEDCFRQVSPNHQLLLLHIILVVRYNKAVLPGRVWQSHLLITRSHLYIRRSHSLTIMLPISLFLSLPNPAATDGECASVRISSSSSISSSRYARPPDLGYSSLLWTRLEGDFQVGFSAPIVSLPTVYSPAYTTGFFCERQKYDTSLVVGVLPYRANS